MKILGISASVFGSKSRILLNTFSENFSKDVDYEIIDLSNLDIQFSDGRDYRDYSGDTNILIQKILEADALLISTPVFQASIPGALKNVFDLLSIDSLRDKVIGMVVSAGSHKHYLVAEYQLKPILTYMKAKPMTTYVFAEASAFNKGEIISDEINMRLEDYALALEKTVKHQMILADQDDFDF